VSPDHRAAAVRVPGPTKNAEKSRHDALVGFVQQMQELHRQLNSAKTAHEQTVIQRQIDATDRQIDRLVYELYGLTEKEIKIVEAANP
jgi:hypothetical protein